MIKILDIREAERKPAILGFLLLAGLMTAHGVMETARDTLFLNKLEATSLPWNYLAIAFLAILVTKANQALISRYDKRAVLAVSSVIAGVCTIGFWFLLESTAVWVFYALYIWAGLVATVVVVQFWLLMSDLVTVTQAKRIFGMVAAGGLIGAATGSGIAFQFLQYFDARHLLLVAGGIFITTMFVPLCTTQHAVDDGKPSPVSNESVDEMRLLRSQPYLRRLLALVFVSTVVFTGVDFLFKFVIAEQYSGAELGQYLAKFYLVVNGFALVAQVILTRWAMSRIGVNASVLILPALLLVGVLGVVLGPFVLATPALVSVLFLKASDGSLKHSLHRTAMEVLYFPLPSDVRSKFKAFIDVLGQRGGQAIASLAILGAFSLWNPTVFHLALVVGAFLVIWLFVAVEMRSHYLNLFRENLRENQLLREVELAQLDFDSLSTLIGTLNSQNDMEVLAAIDLFERYERVRLLPALILYHPSKEVILRALDAFAHDGRTDFVNIAQRFTQDDDDELRAAAVRAIAQVAPDENMLKGYLADPGHIVRATAMVAMVASGFGDQKQLLQQLRDFASVEDPEQRMAVIKAIQGQKDTVFAEVLIDMADAPVVEVRRAVADTMGDMPHESFIPYLVEMVPTAELRNSARRALRKIGRPALDYIDEIFHDESVPRNIRRHLPRTISKFPPQLAIKMLLKHLEHERDDTLVYKLLRGLGRVHVDNPDLRINKRVLRRVLERTLRQSVARLDFFIQTQQEQEKTERYRTESGILLLELLKEKTEGDKEKIFRLLALLNPAEDFELLFVSLSRGAKARAGSTELLEYAIPSGYRNTVLALIDDAPDELRFRNASAAIGYRRIQESYAERLRGLLVDGSDAVRSIAAYHIAELGFVELKDDLQQVELDGESFVNEVIEAAISTLTNRNVEVPSAI